VIIPYRNDHQERIIHLTLSLLPFVSASLPDASYDQEEFSKVESVDHLGAQQVRASRMKISGEAGNIQNRSWEM
jgi:hypothetical protein